MRTWADVAELTNTKNLKGGLVVRCATGLPFVFEEGMEVALVPPVLDAPRRVHVIDAECTGPDGGLVWFGEVDDVSTAELLVGCHCLVQRSQLEQSLGALREFADLSGWRVEDASFGFVGTVARVDDMPGQTLLAVSRPDGRETLVPVVDEFIAGLDEERCCVNVSLPAGLLSL